MFGWSKKRKVKPVNAVAQEELPDMLAVATGAVDLVERMERSAKIHGAPEHDRANCEKCNLLDEMMRLSQRYAAAV